MCKSWDKLNSIERGNFYCTMLHNLPVGRGGTTDEIAELAGCIMGQSGAYITGADVLIDGRLRLSIGGTLQLIK